jgi:multisubunit Na+/H+ antiporter MnhC subunit
MEKIFGCLVLTILTFLGIGTYIFLINGNYIAAYLLALYFFSISVLTVLIGLSMEQAAPTASEPNTEATSKRGSLPVLQGSHERVIAKARDAARLEQTQRVSLPNG